ncbi:hypothetical protein IJJ12_03015, partial [bacterium]|nr:hypothetical protein [bacterium]
MIKVKTGTKGRKTMGGASVRAKRAGECPKRTKTERKQRFRFICDCMMALVLTVGGVAWANGRIQRLLTPTAQVLGVSTKLNGEKIVEELNAA